MPSAVSRFLLRVPMVFFLFTSTGKHRLSNGMYVEVIFVQLTIWFVLNRRYILLLITVTPYHFVNATVLPGGGAV